MTETRRTHQLFLRDDNTYGCAESTLIALQEQWALPDPADSGAAMALNGGIAYSGSTCGAITGAALAVGRLAQVRIAHHRWAKLAARLLIQELMTDFAAAHGAADCRSLTGFDMTRDHAEFIRSGVWRTRCMEQIDFVVDRLAGLGDCAVWDETMARLGIPSGG